MSGPLGRSEYGRPEQRETNGGMVALVSRRSTLTVPAPTDPARTAVRCHPIPAVSQPTTPGPHR